jgi:cytochrome c oxidase cbb3-type subunit 4
MDYHILRAFADSWFLIAMVGFFAAAILWAFRPGSRAEHIDAGQVPFRHEDKPEGDRP